MNGIRAAALLVSAATLAVIAAGCGSSSGNPGVASLGGTATTTTGSDGSPNATSKESGGRAFAACMRSHGVANFPDPSSGGGINIGPRSGINPDSPQFQSAQRACQKLLPAGKALSPAQQAQMQAQLLKFSACMRSHGVPNFPDPQFSAGGARVKIGGGSGINPNSPQFKQAQRECKQYLPGGGKGMTTRVQGKP
jgi:hypothetical protein